MYRYNTRNKKVNCIIRIPPKQSRFNLSLFPPEILINIFRFLPYEQIQTLRLTCKSFNQVGKYLQCRGMRRLRRAMEKVVKKYVIVKPDGGYDTARAGSVLTLAGLIEVADAESYHLIQSGVLPPFPGQLLDELQYGVVLTSRANPVIGRARLCNIVMELERYWREVSAKYANPRMSPPIDDVIVLHTLLDLMYCLPYTGSKVEKTDYGLLVSCKSTHVLPLPSHLIKDLDPFIVELGLRWQLDKTICLHIFKYLHLGQPFSLGLGWFEIDQITLHIACHEPLDRTPSLEDIKHLETHGFVMVVSRTSEPKESLPPMVVSVCVAKSYDCPDSLKNFRCAAL